MRYKNFLSILFLFVFLLGKENDTFGQFLFPELDRAIAHVGQFDRLKEQKIDSLKRGLRNKKGIELFDGYGYLYEAYKIYNYDSAYSWALKQQAIAESLRDQQRINLSQMNLSFILVSAGLFKEAIDILNSINPKELNRDLQMEYYTLMARYYYDLADYSMDRYHSPRYNDFGNIYLDSALQLTDAFFDKAYYSGLRLIRSGDIDAAKSYLEPLIRDRSLDLHQQALATSTMSDIFIQKGQVDSAMLLLVRASIADVQSSTKETSAIFNLSNLLFKKGDLKNASAYIEKAVNDALYYGARQRKVQMSSILPLIEGEKIARVENEKRTLGTYAVLVTGLLLLLIFLIYIIAKQNKKLKGAQIALTSAHQEQQGTNERLQELNARLLEANKIKEEYIGFFYNSNTAFYEKVERFKRKVQLKLAEGKPDEISFLLKNLHIKEEREELMKNFDTIFLNIFPCFIQSFNSLFQPGEGAQLKEGEVFNTELRIFALIRMGIQDNDKIASILGYSVNTINTYKTRVKNRSIIPNEQFEDRIMEIRSV